MPALSHAALHSQSPEIQNTIQQIQSDPAMMEMVQQMGQNFGPGMMGGMGGMGMPGVPLDSAAAHLQQAASARQHYRLLLQMLCVLVHMWASPAVLHRQVAQSNTACDIPQMKSGLPHIGVSV